MQGLVDCNNFFVSCERVFNPRLRNRPVCVLSNNDGCIVALSNEAKMIGLRRGDPHFKVKNLCEANGVEVLSGNHRLYGDMSQRVMDTIASLVENIVVYSVDECFVDFGTLSSAEIEPLAREIVRRVRRNTGIPVSLGAAPTKTLAKIAARFAKKYPAYRGVCLIDNDEKRLAALSLTPIGDVWGIGRRLQRRMPAYAIATAADFAALSEDDVAKIVNINGVRTWCELNGTSCIEIDRHAMPQRQMCCSRSFAENITDPTVLGEAFAMFANIIGRRLRRQRLAANGICVFLQTNSFRDDLPQYSGSAYIPFDEPCNDDMTIASAAAQAFTKAFRRGFAYKRAGILVPETCSADCLQRSLFTPAENIEKHRRLMSALDLINSSSLTRDTVHTASYTPGANIVRCERCSPNYTIRMSDIITINVNHGT